MPYASDLRSSYARTVCADRHPRHMELIPVRTTSRSVRCFLPGCLLDSLQLEILW